MQQQPWGHVHVLQHFSAHSSEKWSFPCWSPLMLQLTQYKLPFQLSFPLCYLLLNCTYVRLNNNRASMSSRDGPSSAGVGRCWHAPHGTACMYMATQCSQNSPEWVPKLPHRSKPIVWCPSGANEIKTYKALCNVVTSELRAQGLGLAGFAATRYLFMYPLCFFHTSTCCSYS